MTPVILDLCGGTGSWSRPYAEAGYDVRVITLPEHDVRDYDPPEEPIHGILAAPPCTMFSLARTRAKTPRDFSEGMEIVEACLRIIWTVRFVGTLKWWALENPTGYLRQFLGKPAMTFKPSEFGDDRNKRTDLWGYFNEPQRLALFATVEKGHHRASAWHDKPGDRATLRSITPPGFARAFFEANQ